MELMKFKTAKHNSSPEVPLSVPQMGGNEWKHLKECLDTNFFSSVGPFVDRLEQKIADYVGTKYAVATVNGTAALHMALLVAGAQPDDEVLVSTLSFIAPANAVRYVGAWPVFMDAEPDYWQMDMGKVQDFFTKECRWSHGTLRNKKTGRRIKAILPVHVLGHPCDMDPLLKLASQYDLVVIEDAAESLGASYKGKKIGHLGHIACFSFNGNKIITAGGGGMIVTDNKKWAEKSKYLTTQARDHDVEYIHNHVGYNYRLTNIQAALGCAQMEQLDAFVAKKRQMASRYTAVLEAIPGITLMQEASLASSTFWLYTILVDEKKYGWDSRSLMRHLATQGIQTRPLWQPLHQSKPYKNCYAYHCRTAERLYAQALSLPSSVGLTWKDQMKVIQLIQDCC